MSHFQILLIHCYTVYCSGQSNEEFSDFDEACERAEELRKEFPSKTVEVLALLDA